MKLHHCRADDNDCPSCASHTLPNTAGPRCFTFRWCDVVCSCSAQPSAQGLLFRRMATHTATSQHIQMHRVIPPQVQVLAPCSVSQVFLMAQPSSFSKFLCTEVLPFSIWTTFPNLELCPDVLRTCFRTLHGVQRIFWTVWAPVLILFVSRYQSLASSS